LPGDIAGVALLPALTVLMSRPEGRQWVVALLSAFAVVALQSSGIILVALAYGIWPPIAIEGSDPHQKMVTAGMILAAPAAIYAMHSLARQPTAANRETERGYADLHPWQTAALVAAGFAALFAMIFAPWPFEIVTLGPVAFLLFVLILYCGGVTAIAWRGAGGRRRALLGRFGLALLIGLAAWPAGEVVNAFLGDLWKGLAGVLAVLAICGAAGYLAWWQLKHFARRNGMLRLVPVGKGGPQLG
jgi:hypothetical protein